MSGESEISSQSSKGVSSNTTGGQSFVTFASLCLLFLLGGFLYLKVAAIDKKVSNHYVSLVADVNDLKESYDDIRGTITNVENSFNDLTKFLKENFKKAIITSVRSAVREELKSSDPNDSPEN